MPVYEYVCEDCQHYFTEIKHFSQYKEPGYCPVCQQQAQKIISAPRLNTMRSEIRHAHETNERSADSPKVHHKHECGAHCHHHQHQKQEDAPAYKQQLNSRPWMLGH